MSKIGKRAILLLLALPIGFNVMAQETKKPMLEELIPGGESYLYAENLYGLQWWGDECIKPGIDTLYSVQPQTGKEEVLFTREQVNKALASADTQSYLIFTTSNSSGMTKRKYCYLETSAMLFTIGRRKKLSAEMTYPKNHLPTMTMLSIRISPIP